MAHITVPALSLPSYCASAHTNGSNYDCIPSSTPTRQTARPTSPLSVAVARPKIETRHVRQSPPPVVPHDCSAHDTSALLSLVDPSPRRNNTGDSTILSKARSHATSQEDSDTDSDDDGYLHISPIASRCPPPPPFGRSSRIPPPPPPPPPWYRPVGLHGGPPPIRNHRDLDSAYSGTESSASDGARDGWHLEHSKTIMAKRRSIRLLRRQLADKRKEMRELRRQMDSIDNALMQVFRPHLVSGTATISTAVLKARFDEMQNIRSIYYQAEDAYEDMELDLSKEEATLEMLEDQPPRFTPNSPYAVPKPPAPFPPPLPTLMTSGIMGTKEPDQLSSDADDSGPPTPVTLLGISGQLHDDTHPLYEELLEAAGDRKLAKEHIDELEMQRDRILYDLEIGFHRKRVRENRGNQISEEDLLLLRSSLAQVPSDATEFERRFGIGITEDDLDFLRDYEVVHNRARLELESATETLNQLRLQCQKKGVMRKLPSYYEEVAIYSSCPDWLPLPQDGNMDIEAFPMPTPHSSYPTTPIVANPPLPSLAHPRFPILLSNPSYVLSLLTPLQALEQALRLPRDDPSAAIRRAECMKELGISALMTKAETQADYINQWLIHRLRTGPLEAELLLAICEAAFRVVNLRRWQEEVLYYWRLDGAAAAAAVPAAVSAAPTSSSQDGGEAEGPAGVVSSTGSGEAKQEHGQKEEEQGDNDHHHQPPSIDSEDIGVARSVTGEGHSIVEEVRRAQSDGGGEMRRSPGLREIRARSVKSLE
ncbi:hypothetical protein P885DRAFT_79501 [Corynascus similis CBS 632.67]